MGKKIKKAVKGVVKVATLGAIDGKSGGWLGGTDGVLNLATLGQAGSGPLGSNVSSAGPDANAEALKLQQLMAQNANVDLSTENVADVATAGTADALDTTKKKRKAPSLSSSLGINAG